MIQDTQIVLPFARLRGKTLQADVDAGPVTSDSGALSLREIEENRHNYCLPACLSSVLDKSALSGGKEGLPAYGLYTAVHVDH